ncbi:uncharacterized protein LOC128708986 [Anopheles marshallii]|uniref:uncharacterized protein LOC128708986 n=1 Tax=Anopheles marshallii TaxID=1521116 RepID=UPI00237C10CF|nr:uncharacterized protein LOC128708986 [Anopheles marshallii]
MEDNRRNEEQKKRKRHPNQASQDEEPMLEQTRRIINNLPITPTMYDGTFPAYEDFNDTLVPDSSVSELSFSSDSPDSDSTVHYQSAGPIIELPSTPLKDHDDHSREYVEFETITPSTIGAALGSGTVLMQRSLENRLAKQLEEMHALMDNDEEIVVLKQPSIRSMASHPAFNREMMRGFMEHSETMFNLVHDKHDNSVQFVIGIEEEEPNDTEAPGCSHRKFRHSTASIVKDNNPESEFVGCFTKDNDVVLYKRTMQESLTNERDDRKSIDALIAHHAECLVEADKITSPTVHVRQGNDNNLLALLTFSDQSSAILKTSGTVAEGIRSEKKLNEVLLSTYRQLLAEPDEMISMQTQAASVSAGPKQHDSEGPHHKHQVRSGVMSNLTNATSSFGLSNESPVGMVVQGSSKNWIKCPKTQHAAEIVLNLRLLLEEYILRNISATGTVLKFVSHVLSDVLRCDRQEIGDDFRNLELVDKIKRVFDELLMPQDLEDPLRMVNRLRHTIEQIQNYPIQAPTLTNGEDAWNRVLEMLEKLSCELDHDIDQPEQFIEALQYGIRSVTSSSIICNDQPATKVVSIDPSSVQVDSMFPSSSSILEIDRYEAPSVSFCKPYACFIERIVMCLWTALVWILNQMNSFWDFLNSPPPALLSDPSVTFHPLVSEDGKLIQLRQVNRDQLNQATNVLRMALEKSSPRTSETEETNRSVNDRSIEMFAQLLHHAGNIELKQSDSQHNIHLQLHASISGVLEKREADEYLTMAGNIRDHEANVAVFFEARIIDMESLAEVESVMECVTRIERLSDDVDNNEVLSEETVVHPFPARLHDDEQVVSELIQEMVSNGIYEETSQLVSSAGPEQLLREIMLCLQDLLEPVTTAVNTIYEQFASGSAEKSFATQADGSNERYTVEMEEATLYPVNDEQFQSRSNSNMDVLISNVKNEDEIVETNTTALQQSTRDSQFAEPLQELLALFHVTNDRLEVMDSDIATIRNQVQQLVTLQQQQHGPSDGTKAVRPEERRSRRIASLKPVTTQTPYETQLTQCPMQRKPTLFEQSGSYCPTEIYSCNAVAPDVLVVHWRVLDEHVLHCITGFEIYIDDSLRSICYSNKRRTALIGNIDLQNHHHIALHITIQPDSGGACKTAAQWAPAFFLYHT